MNELMRPKRNPLPRVDAVPTEDNGRIESASDCRTSREVESSLARFGRMSASGSTLVVRSRSDNCFPSPEFSLEVAGTFWARGKKVARI